MPGLLCGRSAFAGALQDSRPPPGGRGGPVVGQPALPGAPGLRFPWSLWALGFPVWAPALPPVAPPPLLGAGLACPLSGLLPPRGASATIRVGPVIGLWAPWAECPLEPAGSQVGEYCSPGAGRPGRDPGRCRGPRGAGTWRQEPSALLSAGCPGVAACCAPPTHTRPRATPGCPPAFPTPSCDSLQGAWETGLSLPLLSGATAARGPRPTRGHRGDRARPATWPSGREGGHSPRGSWPAPLSRPCPRGGSFSSGSGKSQKQVGEQSGDDRLARWWPSPPLPAARSCGTGKADGWGTVSHGVRQPRGPVGIG